MPELAGWQKTAHQWRLWFHPLELAIRWLRLVLLIALPPALVMGAAGGMAAAWRYGDTYSASCVLRYEGVQQPPDLSADAQSYTIPAFNRQEVGSWLYQWPLYEAVYDASGRNDGVKVLRSLMTIEERPETGHFIVGYRGAHSAQAAVDTLAAFAETAIARAGQIVSERIAEDLETGRQQLAGFEHGLNKRQEALAEFCQESGLVELDDAAQARMRRFIETNDAAAHAEAEVGYAITRLQELPKAIAALPAEVPGDRAAITEDTRRLDDLRDDVRRMRSVYTAEHPLLIAREEELVAFERELTDRPRGSDPQFFQRNPTRDLLAHELAQLELDLPRLQREAQRLQLRADKAEQALALLPEQLVQIRDLLAAIDEAERMVSRMRTLVTEMSLAARSVRSPLSVVDPARAAYVDIRKKEVKVLIVAGIMTALTLVIGLLVVLWLLYRDRRIRTVAAARIAFGTTACAEVPVQAAEFDADRLGDRQWLRSQLDHLLDGHRTVLVIGNLGPEAERLARALTTQAARCDLDPLLIAESDDSETATLIDVLDGAVAPESALGQLPSGGALLPIGPVEDLADRATNGSLERFIKETAQRRRLTFIVVPWPNQVLLRHCAMAVDAVAVVVHADDRHGASFARRAISYDQAVSFCAVTRGATSCIPT